MKTPCPRLPHHMRIAALQCNFEGGRERTLAVPALWKDFGFNVEQLLHPYADLYSAVYDKDRHRELLTTYLEEERKNGIAVILYLNCHILMPSQAAKAHEWAQVDKSGQFVKLYGTYLACCLNSSWAAYFLDAIASLKGMPIAGIFFDGPLNLPCYCPRCDAKFRGRYGKPANEGSEAEIAGFASAGFMEFIRATYRKVKEVNPAWLSYINLPVMHAKASAYEIREILSCNDLVGTEGGFQFYDSPQSADIWRCGVHAKVLDAVAGNKPKVIFMAGDHKPWSWYLHTPAETKLCYASALASGASVWYGIHCSTPRLRSPSGEAAKAMVQFDKAHEDLYARTESAADVALLFSLDTSKNYATSGEKTDFYASDGTRAPRAVGNYRESFHGAYGALFRSGMAFDVVTELNVADLSRYRVLVAPTGACMSRETAATIRAFVKGGGVLIADSETSLYDETFGRQPDFQLSDVFGASFKGYRKYETYDYFECQPDFGLFEDEGPLLIPAPLVALDASVAAGADVLAKLLPPLPGRYGGKPEKGVYAFLVRNRFGKGSSYYLAGTFFELYRQYGIAHYARIIRALTARHSRPSVELTGAPASVEFTVRRSRKLRATVVHLVNYTGGMKRPIERVVPVSGMTLKANKPFRSAEALVSGKPLRVRKGGLIPLPPVDEFEVIVLT